MYRLLLMCNKLSAMKFVVDTSLEIRDRKGRVLFKYFGNCNITGKPLGIPVTF